MLSFKLRLYKPKCYLPLILLHLFIKAPVTFLLCNTEIQRLVEVTPRITSLKNTYSQTIPPDLLI